MDVIAWILLSRKSSGLADEVKAEKSWLSCFRACSRTRSSLLFHLQAAIDSGPDHCDRLGLDHVELLASLWQVTNYLFVWFLFRDAMSQ